MVHREKRLLSTPVTSSATFATAAGSSQLHGGRFADSKYSPTFAGTAGWRARSRAIAHPAVEQLVFAWDAVVIWSLLRVEAVAAFARQAVPYWEAAPRADGMRAAVGAAPAVGSTWKADSRAAEPVPSPWNGNRAPGSAARDAGGVVVVAVPADGGFEAVAPVRGRLALLRRLRKALVILFQTPSWRHRRKANHHSLR
jgi:hypothetical protein